MPPDLDATKSSLSARQVQMGEVQQGDYGKIAQLTDLDGNVITLAEPPSRG